MRSSRRPAVVLALGLGLVIALTPARGDDGARSAGTQAIDIVTPAGDAVLSLLADRPLTQPAPKVTHVLVTIHGAFRDVKSYFSVARHVVKISGTAADATMVVAPDFLLKEDVAKFHLSASTLFWTESGWKQGLDAVGPVPISSYTALDAVLAHFANRTLYPALTEIVVFGHSAGGQVVQRYAVTSQIEDALRSSGIRVRYVVANPSSYLYFNDMRPGPDGKLHPADPKSCPSFTQWHHGFSGAPPYVASRLTRELERGYVARNVTYLLGMSDTDTKDPQLDKSCAGNAEGPYRLARGLSYFAYLRSRHAEGLNHRVVEVPGIGHDEKGLYESDCGIAVLFNRPVPAACPHDP